MIIDQLPLLSGDVVSADEIPVERGTTTYKTTPDKFLAAMTKDATPTEGSKNAVESGGVYDALQTKQNALTFDSAPTQGSSNPVTSGGVYTAIENATPDGFVSYAEAQTLTTAQQAQARGNIGANWDLLWQNQDAIGSDFSAQTVLLDLSGKSELKIYAAHYDGMDSSHTGWGTYVFLLPIGANTSISISVTASNKVSYTNFRYVLGTATGVVFGNGIECSSANGSSIVANSMQPLRIYAR